VDEASDRTRWIRRWEGAELPASGVWRERRRLAAAMREVMERLATSDAPEDELRRAADRLEQYAAHLATHPPSRRYEGYAESATASEPPEGGGHFDYSPLIGRANPLAPPIVMHSTGTQVRGTVRFGTAYEGPPGCLHGGFVAAAFDEVLGYTQSLTGNPGMTGTLTVRYRRPTPLHTELRFEARVDRVEGRKIFASGTLHAGGALCAEAEGIFVSIDRTRFRDLVEAREARERS
jgi:acyl-coenzyme A thioesterase PaaI-like protein